MARRKVILPNWANTEDASKSVEMLNEAFEGLTQGELVINTEANNTLLTTLNENGTPVTAASHPSLAGVYGHPAYGTFEIVDGGEGKLVFQYGSVTGELRIVSDEICMYTGVLDGLCPIGVKLYPEANGDLRMDHPDNYGLILKFVKEA